MSFARLASQGDQGDGSTWLQVWLEAGREGQVFTYANPEGLTVGAYGAAAEPHHDAGKEGA